METDVTEMSIFLYYNHLNSIRPEES
jgi:hypothetical protein